METRKDVTRAVLASYRRGAQRSDEVQVSAVDDPGKKVITQNNLIDRSIPTPTVWVNGTYLYRAETIPPRGQMVVKYANMIRGQRRRPGNFRQRRQSGRVADSERPIHRARPHAEVMAGPELAAQGITRRRVRRAAVTQFRQ